MKHISTFEKFLAEAMSPGSYQIRAAMKKLNVGLKDDDIVFTVDDEKLDQMLNLRFNRQLDFQEVNGDSYYILNQKDFDRFIDLADSSGFDVDYENSEDSVVYVQESIVNEDVEYSVGDFPIGAEVAMGDEVWKVVKPGARGEKIIMAPFNAEAKRKYISIAIEFDLNWLNANITKINK